MLGRFFIELHFSIEVNGDIGELFLDVSGNFSFGGGGEIVAYFRAEFDHLVGETTSGEVHSHDTVGHGVPFEDGHSVGDSVSGIDDDTGGTS